MSNNSLCNHFGLFMLMLFISYCWHHVDANQRAHAYTHTLEQCQPIGSAAKRRKTRRKRKRRRKKRSTTKQHMKKIKNFVNTHLLTHQAHGCFVCAALMLAFVIVLMILLLHLFTTFIKCFQFANFWALLMRKPNLYISFRLSFAALMSPSAFSLLKNKEPKSLTPSVKSDF